jgi:gluconate kinase
MPATLLASQFATLEEPGDDERPIRVFIGCSPAEIVETIVTALSPTSA